MQEFWNQKYVEENTHWGFEPADSAIYAKDFFLAHNAKHILIPGIGYGRNARIFADNGIRVTGIEISEHAIRLAKSANKLDIPIYHGSVNNMPFDDCLYDGIFCYALIHLLNRRERKNFLRNCFNQLKPGGLMIFTAISAEYSMFGKGKRVSFNRYELMKGLQVYFYGPKQVRNEFGEFGLVDYREMNEPIKHMPEEPPLECFYIVCKK